MLSYVRKQFWTLLLFEGSAEINKLRFIYLRVIVDGLAKETSSKRKWDINRWDQKTERAIGSKEDAKALNFFLDSLLMKINECKTELLYSGKFVTAQKIMDYVLAMLHTYLLNNCKMMLITWR
jgi:hypothetical protein